MLTQISGILLDSPPWRTFSLDRVLQYYDGPRLLLQRSQSGQLYLAWWSDSDETTERWIYLPLSESRLRSVLLGETPSYDALHAPEDGHIFVIDRYLATDEIVQTVLTSAESLPQDALPLAGARLNIPMPKEIIGGITTRERAHLLDIRLEVGSSHQEERIGARVIGRFLEILQNLLDSLGQAREGQATLRGSVPALIQARTRLDLVGIYSGSFGMRLETNAEDDLSGRSLVGDSLGTLFDLLDAGSHLTESGDQLEALKGRTAKNYNNLLSTIETPISSISLNWSQPGSMSARQTRISRQSARNIIAQIKAASFEATVSTIQDSFVITGRFIKGSVRTLKFEFQALSTHERFTVKIDKNTWSLMEQIRLGSISRVSLQPELHVNEATGDERTTYTVLNIEQMIH